MGSLSDDLFDLFVIFDLVWGKKGWSSSLLNYSFHDRIFRPIVNSSGAYLFSLFTTTVLFCVILEEGPWSPFNYCHILEYLLCRW